MNTAKAANFAEGTSIADMLPSGRENAVATETLCNMLGVGVRELRKMIADERQAGAIILSDTSSRGGYYKPGSKEEAEEFVRILNSKAIAIQSALKSARQYLKMPEGQIRIDDQEVECR